MRSAKEHIWTEHLLGEVELLYNESAAGAVTWLNHYSIMQDMRSSINLSSFSHVGVDGSLLRLILRKPVPRTSADLLLPRLLETRRAGHRLALVGGTTRALLSAQSSIRASYQNIEVPLAIDGYAGMVPAEDMAITLNSHSIDTVILGLGAPLQDKYAADLLAAGCKAVIFTAGGWLDQVSQTAYYPKWAYSLNLNWLVRLLKEPKRLWRRYSIDAVRAILSRDSINAFGERFLTSQDSDGPKPKLLQIVTQIERAGAQQLAADLDESLRQDFEVSTKFLYAKFDHDKYSPEDALAGGRPKAMRQWLTLMAKVARLGIMEKPDVLVLHTHYAFLAGLIIKAVSWRSRIVLVHHWPEDRYPNMVRAMLTVIKRAAIKEIYVADSIAPEGATVIPNPVPELVRNILTPERNTDTFLVAARHAEEKRIDLVLDALAQLPDYRLRLAGSGPLTRQLSDKVDALDLRDRVTFLGSISRPQLMDEMRSCAAMILPSDWEALPMVLLEAVANDCPLIVSDIPAHQLFRDGGAALSFRRGDADHLADRMQRCSHPHVQDQLRQGRLQLKQSHSKTRLINLWRSELVKAAG